MRCGLFPYLFVVLAVGSLGPDCLLQSEEIETVTDDSVSVLIADQSVTIPPPILTGDRDAAEQERLITAALRGLSYRQFVRDSVVAPVRIDLSYVKDASGTRIGHNVHVMFIVHTSLTTFSSDRFSEMLVGESDAASQQESTVATADTLRSLGLNDGGENIRYQRLQFDLLDKIRFDGLIRVTHTESASQNRLDISLVPEFENRWRATEEDSRGGTFTGLRGWLTATEIDSADAVLIEARVVFHEPTQWFRGDNFLRSKLPLVLQESARDLRRRLKSK